LQIFGYNVDLYKTYEEATISTHGLAIIAVLGTVSYSRNMFSFSLQKTADLTGLYSVNRVLSV